MMFDVGDRPRSVKQACVTRADGALTVAARDHFA